MTTLNWQLTLMIVAVPLAIIAVLLMFLIDPLMFLVMWVIMALLAVCAIVFATRGAIAAYHRRPYRYPISIPFFT